MRKRTKFKSLLRDFFVLVFCLSAAAFFAWLFWQDLNAFTVRGDKTEIGTISFKHNVAQRKFDDRVVWERIISGTKLYYGDTIRTADLAQAVLTLNDGTMIELGENTMIQVGANEAGKLQISISGGDIQIDSSTASSNVQIKLDDGSVVNVDAGTSLAAKSDSESGLHNVEVVSGSARITTEDGQSAEISDGESVNVEKGKEIQKNAVTVIYPPKELKILNTTGSYVPVRFEWKTTEPGAVTLQTSFTRDFKKIATSREFSSSSAAEMRLESGVIFWRLFIGDEKSSAVEGRLSIENLQAVSGISPAGESLFKYRSSLPKISFRWTGNDYAERYRLLISSTPDMRSVVTDSEFTGNFATIGSLEEGDYWWQVTPFYSLNGLGYAGGSEAYPFRIVRSREIRPPELSVPAGNARIVYKEKIPGNFIWKSELKDAEYEILIARDYDFTNLVYSANTKDTRYTKDFLPEELHDGIYYWKVLRKSSDADDKTPESEIRSFSIARYVPEDNRLLYPPDNFSVEAKKFPGTAFMWKLSDEYEKSSVPSVIQIATNSNFSAIQVERTTSSMVLDNISLTPGNYWWRVGVRDESGSVKDFTQSRMITVLSELEPPVIVFPEQNSEVLVYNYAPVTVSWNANPRAEYYSVRICTPDGELVRQMEEVRDTSAKFVLEEGNYTCFVQAASDSSRLSVASERNFSVRSPSAILAQSPGDGMRIAGLTALRNPVIFTWIPGKDKVSSYKFILSKLQKDGSFKVVDSVSTTKTNLSLNRLKSGTYSWKISASTADGIPVDSKTLRFIVDGTPDLQPPVLVSPAKNFVMNGEWLKKHRNIEFSWNEVAGATAYTFVLYKLDSSGKRKLIYTEKNTKAAFVRIKDLSILDVGTFEWTVTPYSYAKDGYLEQKGNPGSRVFKIEFASPTKVEAVKPGMMYGN